MARGFSRLTETLTSTDLRWLSFAVREAEAWRGSQVGNPDPAPLQEFDKRIVKMRAALKAAKLTKQKYDDALDN